VQAFFWIALSLLLAAFVGGIAWCAFTGLGLWRAIRSASREVLGSLERTLGEAEQLAARGEALAGKGEHVLDAVARLQRSIARARVLSAALGETTSLVSALRRLVPVK
jgi:hypothetical protein